MRSLLLLLVLVLVLVRVLVLVLVLLLLLLVLSHQYAPAPGVIARISCPSACIAVSSKILAARAGRPWGRSMLCADAVRKGSEPSEWAEL